ncbi:MAG: decaprenyl-phosphate phosphoribosyltransferase [Bacillota bacterium]|nr:MAG: decaprenyl-phosphate phosphoribosyltransferase [Bacillota bacterium]
MVKLLLLQLRPKQWTKNLLVFAAYVFSVDRVGTGAFWRAALAFLLFSLVSGCVYILNDFVDLEADRQHPEKRHRPMASGRLSPAVALAFGAVALLVSLAAAFRLSAGFGWILVGYFALNLGYSFFLKHLVIVDIMAIAAGFVLRALGGSAVIDVAITPWFLLCVFLLSLLLATGKRRHEVLLLKHQKGLHRKVLDQYSVEFLDQIAGILTTGAILAYSMFTFLSGRTPHLMWTIPLVIYGMFRYLYLVHVLGQGGKPEDLLFQDRSLLAAVLLYGVAVVVILKWFPS